jgi:predicted unusual protein kinase regulating ubiquinone biosynthesis (AarF/ABC1/UbiB family)
MLKSRYRASPVLCARPGQPAVLGCNPVIHWLAPKFPTAARQAPAENSASSHACHEMIGVMIKVGQFLSPADVLPREIIDELRACRTKSAGTGGVDPARCGSGIHRPL